jgi:hypothetical protein
MTGWQRQRRGVEVAPVQAAVDEMLEGVRGRCWGNEAGKSTSWKAWATGLKLGSEAENYGGWCPPDMI